MSTTTNDTKNIKIFCYLERRIEQGSARKSGTALHMQNHRRCRDRSASSDLSPSPRHPSLEPPQTAAKPQQSDSCSSGNPFEDNPRLLNPFEESSASSMNPFETSFESDGPTPRVSVTMDDKAAVEPEGGTTAADVLDAAMTRDSSMASSYDNMAETMADKMADNDHVIRSDRSSPSSFDVADTLNNESAEAMTKSCDSITTLQEVLEDYESVMSGIGDLLITNFFKVSIAGQYAYQVSNTANKKPLNFN
jgi:hypothetical protein